MDLNEQAERAVNAVLADADVIAADHERRVAKLAWLDGYKAGMDAVGSIAQASFERLKAELS
jgi:hypothetical protein